jgi:hypothetical protein
MKANKNLLKSIEELLKTSKQTGAVKRKTLSSKQLEALKKGRKVLAQSKLSKGSGYVNKLRNLVDLTYLVSGLISIIKLFKSGVMRSIGLLLYIYLKLKSIKLFEYFKLLSYIYLILGFIMLVIFNYNQIEYTAFLINSYDSFWEKSYDYLRSMWENIKHKFLGKSADSINEMEALEKFKKEVFDEIARVKEQAKNEFINEIGRDRYQELQRMSKGSSNNK